MRDLYDIHCHILPGVDDGAKDMDMALSMIEKEIDAGVETIILTPHFRKEMFEPDMEDIWSAYDTLVDETRNRNIRLYLGCEFHANMEMVRMLREGEIASMAGSRYVLAEFGGSSEASYIKERLYSLLASGYKPIAAHIERYEATRSDIDFVEELVDMGAYMQINADSIIGKEGFGTKRYCKKLMKYDLVHFVGSDCHNLTSRVSRIGEAYNYVSKKMDEAYADHLFIENPRKILADAKKRKER